MAGLREEKKKQNQSNIIRSAKKIFNEKGYQQATMVMIAKDANVGTGTIYNYFPSKGSLLLTIFNEEVSKLKQENQTLITGTNSGLVESIAELMSKLTDFFSLYPKSFWRELFHVVTEEAEDSIFLRNGMFNLDEEAMGWVKQIIIDHSDSFRVPINPDEAVNTIYAQAMMQTILYIYNDSYTKELFLEQLMGQIAFIFAGKLKDENEEI